jgi:hypothetical protein
MCTQPKENTRLCTCPLGYNGTVELIYNAPFDGCKGLFFFLVYFLAFFGFSGVFFFGAFGYPLSFFWRVSVLWFTKS